MTPTAPLSHLESTLFSPEALATEGHDIGHLLREALRELKRMDCSANFQTSHQRVERIIRLAQDHCDSLIEGARLLQAGSPQPALVDRCDLASIAASEIALWTAHAAASSLTLTLHGSRPPTVTGNQALLARALRNLVLNGIAEASPATRIDVTVAEQDARTVAITVANTGRAISSEIAERFKRPLTPAPLTAGIGLFIVSRIAILHNGTLRCAHQGGITSLTFTIENTK